MEPEQGPLGVRVKLGHLLVGEDFPLQSRPALKKLAQALDFGRCYDRRCADSGRVHWAH